MDTEVALNPAILRTSRFGPIPLRVRKWNDRIFLECSSVDEVTAHLLQREPNGGYRGAETLRGVIIEGQGGFFEAFDNLGGTIGPHFSLSPTEVASRILGSLLWRVPTV